MTYVLLQSEKERELFELLWQLPPNLAAAEQLLQQGNYTTEEVTRVATEYAEMCRWDYEENGENGIPEAGGCAIFLPDRQSANLPQVVSLLLTYRLDPNRVYWTKHFVYYNIMDSLQFNANGYVAADTLRLLLEHGGDPHLPLDGETLFEYVDFSVVFDVVEHEKLSAHMDSRIHYWLVLRSFVDETEEFILPEGSGDFDSAVLREHRNFIARRSPLPGGWRGGSLSILDRRTGEEVLRA